jgi:F-type H+-transporting ATPase subunit b
MQIDWWTLALQTINVVILIWILSRFLFTPVANILKQRQEAAQKLLDDARALKLAAAAEHEKAAEETARITASRSEALKAAAAEAEAQKSAILTAARSDADQLRADARASIERLRKNDAIELGDRASRLAVDIAAKLLGRLREETRIAGFLDGLADGVAALPEATRASMGANGSSLRIKTARALTKAEAQACRSKLAEALGRPVQIDVETDPSLIAGLEIETPHAVVRNSFRADLDRIASELTRNGHAEH